MKSNKFLKFKYINLRLFKILKNIENQKTFDKNKEIIQLKKFTLECKKILDFKNIRALIICLYPVNYKGSKFSAHSEENFRNHE